MTAEQLRKMVDRIKYRYIDIDILSFFPPSVVFLRSILADRFRNKISAQVSVCTHANVLIRLASTIDEISFFKFFAFSSPFVFLSKEKDHPSLALSLPLCLSIGIRRTISDFFYWNEREKKKQEDNKTMFQSM